MQPKKNKAAIVSKIGCVIIGIVYVAVLLKLVVFKNGLTTSCRGFNIIPCDFIIGLISGEMTFQLFVKNVLGNIAVFVPLGIILSVLLQKLSVKKIVCIGFFTSLTIELVQLIVGLGICDIDDLITNTIGVIIGVALYWKLTKSWDEHWENSFASLMMLCFIGLSSATLLFFFGYGSKILATPVERVNLEVLNGLDEQHATAEVQCEDIVDSKLIGYQNKFDEAGEILGTIQVTYDLHQNTCYYLDTIKADYSINGNVTKVTSTYSQITEAEYLDLLKKDGMWSDIWLDDANQCYAVMATVHES